MFLSWHLEHRVYSVFTLSCTKKYQAGRKPCLLLSYLCGLVSFSMDEDRGLQVVVGVGPERPLQEGAILDTRLNLGQRQVLREKQLTASDLILGKKKKKSSN